MNTPEKRRVKRGWMNLRVAEVYEETHDTKTFRLEDADEGGRPYDFIAGQYLTFRFDSIAEKPVVRSYTMSGSPRDTNQSIFTVKRVVHGIVSNWLCDEVKVGDILRARGPIGKFVYDYKIDNKHLYMVAGGSGVTPFTSIVKEYADKLGSDEAPESLNLLVAYRSQKDLINWRELCWAAKHPGVRIAVTLTREQLNNEKFLQGRPTTEMLDIFVNPEHLPQSTFMTCGPQAIMDLTTSYAQAHNVEPEQVKTESFE